MSINWYPGHMARTRRVMVDDLKNVDMVCEIMLKLGVPLTYSITPVELDKKTAYMVGDDCLLMVCLAHEIKPEDVEAMERTRTFHGTYHVLHGLISPVNGIGADQLKIRELLHRVAEESVDEVILATSPNVEGQATALYLNKL